MSLAQHNAPIIITTTLLSILKTKIAPPKMQQRKMFVCLCMRARVWERWGDDDDDDDGTTLWVFGIFLLPENHLLNRLDLAKKHKNTIKTSHIFV